MVRLHLVGFTTDLKNLIFADERGAKAGFVITVDSRLRNTLDEVARLEGEADPDYAEDLYEPDDQPAEELSPPPKPRPKVSSKLTPKEIQSLLRQGKTEEQVARLAQTNVDWIERFSFAILAERRDVIDAVRAATLSKPRLGLSGMNIGEAVEENLGAKRLRMGPEAMDAAWKAVRKNGRWHVSFEYVSRGQKRLARYSFDPSSRLVEPLNEIALDLGWRADPKSKANSPNAAPSPRVSGSIVKPTAARSNTATPRQAAAGKPASPGTRTSTSTRGSAAGTRAPAGGPRSTSRGMPTESVPGPRKPRAPGASAARVAPPTRAPLPQPGPPPAPRRRSDPEVPEAARSKRAAPPDKGDARGPSGGFTLGKPKGDRAGYGSLPKVWRPSRRP